MSEKLNSEELKTKNQSFFIRLLSTPNGLIGLTIVIILIFSAGFADFLAPFSPTKMGVGKRFLPPNLEFILGTDEFGRDMVSRILFGSRLTLMIGAMAVGISMTTGIIVGLFAAYKGGWLETLLMRSTDILFSFTEIKRDKVFLFDG